MGQLAIRLNEDEDRRVHEWAAFEGQPVSTLVKKSLFQTIEDWADYNTAMEGHARWVRGGMKGHTLDQVAKRLKVEL